MLKTDRPHGGLRGVGYSTRLSYFEFLWCAVCLAFFITHTNVLMRLRIDKVPYVQTVETSLSIDIQFGCALISKYNPGR